MENIEIVSQKISELDCSLVLMSQIFENQVDSQKSQRRWRREDKQIASEADDLPIDVVTEILLRLPPKDICKFRCISKQWRCLLTKDTEFTSRYHELAKRNTVLLAGRYILDENGEFNIRRATVELTSVDMEGNVVDKYNIITQGGIFRTFISCGPLVLLCCTYALYVCNPSRQEATFVPYIIQPGLQFAGIRFAGFSYLPASCEYKIVGLYWPHPQCDEMRCQIFTFRDVVKTGSWRASKATVCSKSACADNSSLNVGRKIYWPCSSGDKSRSILSLDLEDEKFNCISYPAHDCNMYSFMEISRIRGSLGAIACTLNSSTMEVWLFNDREKGWSMERHIRLFPFTINYVVSLATESDEVLIHTEQRGVVIYNIRSLSWRRINYFEDLNRPCAYHYGLSRLHKIVPAH